MKRAPILMAAAVAYLLAAWMVAPGFYDGFTPQSPYNFVCPPIHIAANQPPGSGHLAIQIVDGASDATSGFTSDTQVVIGFLPGAFDGTDQTTISIDVTPLPTCPQPPGIRLVTNVYQIIASAPLVKAANLVLRYSNLEPAPSDVYFASDPAGPWKALGIQQQAQVFTVVTSTKSFGYFAAGYPSASPPPGAVSVGGGQTLPIIVAVLIVLVVLAGVPLAILRRRQSKGGVEEEGDV